MAGRALGGSGRWRFSRLGLRLTGENEGVSREKLVFELTRRREEQRRSKSWPAAMARRSSRGGAPPVEGRRQEQVEPLRLCAVILVAVPD